MDINFQNLIINPHNSNFFKDYQTFLGILISAIIGLLAYFFKEKCNRLKTEANNFFLIFFFIKTNLEEINALRKGGILPAVDEINKYLMELNKIKYFGDQYHGKKAIDTNIYFPDENSRKNFIVQKSNKEVNQDNLILVRTFKKLINEVKEKDLESEALFFVNYENINFQQIYKTLEFDYKRINNLIASLRNAIEKNEPSDSNLYKFEVDFSDVNYEIIIEKEMYKIFKYKNLYETLLEILEYSLLYSDIAMDHLSAFSYHYSKKYKIIFELLGIKFGTLKGENILYQIKDLTFIYNDLDNLCTRHLWEIPLYNCLKLNFWDKFLNLFHRCKDVHWLDPETSLG